MSRTVPIYIDLESGKYVVKGSEINNTLQAFKAIIETPATTWVVVHGQNTFSVIVKVYVNDVEVKPDSIVLTDSNRITISFSEETTGVAHVFLFDVNSYVPPASPTPTPTVTSTATVTPTITPNTTLTPTPTVTASVTPTFTPTVTVTPTFTATPTITVTATPTVTITPTVTGTPGVTITPTVTVTPTFTPTVTPTYTVTPTVTPSPTALSFLNASLDYRFDQSSGDLINYGSIGSSLNLSQIDTPLLNQSSNPVKTGIPYAVLDRDLGQGWTKTGITGQLVDHTTGCFIAVLRIDTVPDDDNYFLLLNREGTTTLDTSFYFTYTSASSNQIVTRMGNQGTWSGYVNPYAKDFEGTGWQEFGIADGEWHVLVVRQNGTRMDFFLDGQPNHLRAAGSNVTAWLNDAVVSSNQGIAVGGSGLDALTDITDNEMGGAFSRILLSPVVPTDKEIYDITREIFGENWTAQKTWFAVVRGLFLDFRDRGGASVNGYEVYFNNGDAGGIIYPREPASSTTTLTNSGTSNPAPGMAYGNDGILTNVTNWPYLSMTGQWKFISAASISVTNYYGATQGCIGLVFRRPNGNAATTYINCLLGAGSSSTSTITRGFSAVFADSSGVNNPNKLTIGWWRDLTGEGVTDVAKQTFDVSTLLNDTDWHFLIIQGTSTDPVEVWLDGVQLTAETVVENGLVNLTHWGNAVGFDTTVRPGFGGGGSTRRAYYDLGYYFVVPDIDLLSQSKIQYMWELLQNTADLSLGGDFL